MCFRPSAMIGNEPQVQVGTCPHCGLPVAASIGIDSGECPYCHKPIPAKAKDDADTDNPLKNVKLF